MLKSQLKERIFWPLLTIALAGVLIALGTLQYRWSKEVSDATTARLRASLNSSMLAFRQDFERELSNLTAPVQTDGPSTHRDLAERFRSWKSTASHSGMVKSVYLAEQDPQQEARLFRLNEADSIFETTSWPTELIAMKATLPRFSIRKSGMPPFHIAGERVFGQSGGAESNAQFFVRTLGIGMVDEGPDRPEGALETSRSNSVVQRSRENRDPHSGPTELAATAKSNEVATKDGAKHEVPFRRFPKIPWFVDTSVPALICSSNPFWNGRPEQESARWIIIELDQDFLQRHLFPELAARYFADSNGFGYDVAVVDDKNGVQDALIFGNRLALTQADAKLSLFGPPGPTRALNAMAVELHSEQKAILNEKHEFSIGYATHDPESSAAPLMLMSAGPGDGDWLLVVRNRLGSLEAAASSLRRRELGLSFGVLLILAGTMGMLIAASRRAHRLARLQMDFVAGVSHELRTPLAVISSAAENIADGLIENREQIARYGNVIKNHSAQLKQLVEQILLFAATRHGRQHYTLRILQPAVVIDLALENTAELIRTAGITVEKNVQPHLPAIPIDVDALAHSLQNLITNAVKYGGDARWIGVSAAKRTNANETEIAITISDRGIGIGVDEVGHVFDPFFRCAAVREAQIHGSGLGLPLAKSIVEAMGGYITVDSAPGSGSSFTVHLPVPKAAAPLSEALERPAVGSERLIQSHE